MAVSDDLMYRYANQILIDGECPLCKGKTEETPNSSYWRRKYRCGKCGKTFTLIYDDVDVTEQGEDIVELISVEIA